MNETYQKLEKEILRWNEQISLISRQQPEKIVKNLIRQCHDGIERVEKMMQWAQQDYKRVWYFDLGSGGGLPGLVWHQWMGSNGYPVTTRLVEPREKRAWFLERTARVVGAEDVRVDCCRWGVCAPGEDVFLPQTSEKGLFLISMKALRLREDEVLKGLSAIVNPVRTSSHGNQDGKIDIQICRFIPPGTALNDRIRNDLGLLAGDWSNDENVIRLRNLGAKIVPTQKGNSGGADILISMYTMK